MWEDGDVPVGTFRENLLGGGEALRKEGHFGRQFKYGR